MSDLISREDAIDALGEEPEIWNDTEEEWAYRNAWVEHISAIKALPSAEAVEGKWISAEQQVTVTIYDEEHEEHLTKRMTVEEMLDTYTNEGCPTMRGGDDE